MQNRVLFVKQDSQNLFYRTEGPGNTKISDRDLVEDYFNLKISLKDLYEEWVAKDAKHFKKVHWGVRILRQDPWETLCAFICSSNNNIKRISKMVESLCTHFGPFVAEIHGHKYYDFPEPSALAKDPEQTEQTLRELGFGYRAKYIAQTAKLMTQKPENFLFKLRLAGVEECTEALTAFSGVGPKVADCVSLMSLDKHSVVPIDTHMYQIASRNYNLKFAPGNKSYKEVQNKLAGIWGDYAGWAHSVLFAGDLPDLDTLKPERDLEREQIARKKIKTEPKLEIKV